MHGHSKNAPFGLHLDWRFLVSLLVPSVSDPGHPRGYSLNVNGPYRSLIFEEGVIQERSVPSISEFPDILYTGAQRGSHKQHQGTHYPEAAQHWDRRRAPEELPRTPDSDYSPSQGNAFVWIEGPAFQQDRQVAVNYRQLYAAAAQEYLTIIYYAKHQSTVHTQRGTRSPRHLFDSAQRPHDQSLCGGNEDVTTQEVRYLYRATI